MKNQRKPEVFDTFLCFRVLDSVCQKWSWAAEAGKWSLLVKSLIVNWSLLGGRIFSDFFGGSAVGSEIDGFGGVVGRGCLINYIG